MLCAHDNIHRNLGYRDSPKYVKYFTRLPTLAAGSDPQPWPSSRETRTASTKKIDMAPKEKKEKKELADPGQVARDYANPTPSGELKSMEEPMIAAYMAHVVEASWNDW